MYNCLRAFSFSAMMLITLTNPVIAQDDFYNQPKITKNGDYVTNAGPVKGNVTSGIFSQGSLWYVVSSDLKCREQADINTKIVRSFKKNAIIQADVGGGGADEVLYNAPDNQGRTWMRARSQNGKDYHCYVRANKKYIRPVIK